MSNWSTKINVRTVSANPIVKIINFIVAILGFCLVLGAQACCQRKRIVFGC